MMNRDQIQTIEWQGGYAPPVPFQCPMLYNDRNKLRRAFREKRLTDDIVLERSQRIFYQGLSLPVGKHKTFTVSYLLKRMETWAD